MAGKIAYNIARRIEPCFRHENPDNQEMQAPEDAHLKAIDGNNSRATEQKTQSA